jgi:magnesium-transporting ATPase (P-type)
LLTGRDEAVSEVGARLEQNLDYVAVTAVEDKLQDRVPETIKFFREAGVGLWVLTGDKRETAENIGYSANLLDKKMNVVHIQASTADELTAQLTDAKRKYVDDGPVSGRLSMTRNRSAEAKRHAPLLGAQGSGEHGHGSRGSTSLDGQNDGDMTQPSAMRRVSSKLGDGMRSLSSALSFGEKQKYADAELGLVIDGASLAHAIESHPDQFMALADRCKTIICCRVTPLQKALVVRMVREMRKALTLAVGDGGNDVSMIQEAHVGVGIFGKEGTQAARASDYAISEFKHLQRLLSIHGRFSYVRTAGMINLSFYKNIFFTLTQVLFQIYNFDTGTTFQDQWIVSAFNVIVTAAPPFLFGIFERDLEESTITRFPGVYSSNRGDRLFSLRTVIEFTLLYGLWHCICVFFGVFFGLGYLTIPFKNGKDGGLFFTAFGSSVMIVIIALSKFILHSHVLNWIILLLLALSFAAFFGLVPLAIYAVQEYPLEGQLLMLFSSPQFYLTCALVIAAAFVVDFVVLVTRQLMFPNVVGTLQRWEQNHGQSKESQA